MLFKILGKIWKRLPKGGRTLAGRVFQVKFTASAGGIITNNEGKVLLLNHVMRPVSGWGVPGGFFNAGEQPEAAFRREVREETGLDLADVSVYRIRTLERHIEVIFLAKGVGSAEVKSREIIELAWFDLDEMPAEMPLDQQFLIRRALGL